MHYWNSLPEDPVGSYYWNGSLDRYEFEFDARVMFDTRVMLLSTDDDGFASPRCAPRGGG